MNLACAAEAPESVGTPLDGVQIHIVDDANQPVPTGASGHLAVARPGSPTNYIDGDGQLLPIPTRGAALQEGVDTGDLARLDEHGLLYITGRRKLLINVAGAKVNPVEVEEQLLDHAMVKDAIVIGLPDEYRGEVVGAVVETMPGTAIADLTHHLRERVSSYAIPRIWHFVDAIPRTAAGKQDRLRALTILEGRLHDHARRGIPQGRNRGFRPLPDHGERTLRPTASPATRTAEACDRPNAQGTRPHTLH
jgi:long-chain acyl-CoA synthetase